MLNYKNVTHELLGKYESEWIGIQWWYLCTMECEGRTIRYSIMFDADDVAQIIGGGEVTDADIEDMAEEYSWFMAEELACKKYIDDVIKSADETIAKYNNGARYTIADNYDVREIADDFKGGCWHEELQETIAKMKDQGETDMLCVNALLYDELDIHVEEYCDEHGWYCVDTDEVVNALLVA